MLPVNTTLDNKEPVHYIPYHPVVREEKETKKVHIFFYASSKLKAIT